MASRFYGLENIIRSKYDWIPSLCFWLVGPLLLEIVGYSWPLHHLTKTALLLGPFYLFLNLFHAIIVRLPAELEVVRLPRMLRRLSVCCAYALVGLPLDLLASVGEVLTYWFLPWFLLLWLFPLFVIHTLHELGAPGPEDVLHALNLNTLHRLLRLQV